MSYFIDTHLNSVDKAKYTALVLLPKYASMLATLGSIQRDLGDLTKAKNIVLANINAPKLFST